MYVTRCNLFVLILSYCFAATSSHYTFSAADVKCRPISRHKKAVHLKVLGESPNFSPGKYPNPNTSVNVYRSTGRLIQEVPFQNGFVGTVMEAYNNHHKLRISPDHVWLAIVQAFNIYMNDMANAEELRDHFVMHKGKMVLNVRSAGTLETVNWAYLVGQMSKRIRKHTKIGVLRWIIPNFSTTTTTDRIVGKLFLMATLKRFFKYKFSLLCGIPEITLEGSVDDWKNIRQRIEKLKQFGLTKWYYKLVPVINELIHTAQKRPNLEFWGRILHKEKFASGPDHLSGWINVFIPFINKKYVLPTEFGKYGSINTDQIPAGISTVPFELNDNGKKYKLDFCFGFFGCTQKGNVEIRPSLDWLIRDQYLDTFYEKEQEAYRRFLELIKKKSRVKTQPNVF